jgi:hypothetical protein
MIGLKFSENTFFVNEKTRIPICLTEYQNKYYTNRVQFFKNYLRARNVICAAVPVIFQ